MKSAFLRTLLFFFLISLARQVQAQTPTWQAAVALTTFNSSSGYVSAAATTPAGDVFIVGSFSGGLNFSGITLSSYGGTDGFVAKWSGTANQFVWAQRVAGLNNDFATSVAVSGSSVYVVGTFNSANLVIGSGNALLANAGGFDAYIVKFTDAGTSASYTWGQRIGGISTEEAAAVAVSGSSVFLTGYIGNNGTVSFGTLAQPASPATYNTNDAYLAKLTDAGATSSFAWVQLSGGTDDDRAAGVAVSGSSVYVAGLFRSATFQAGSTALANAGGTSRTADLFVTRYTDTGTGANVAWAQRTGGLADEQPLALAVNGPSVYVAGKFRGTAVFGATTLVAQDTDGFVVKLSDGGSAGVATWAQRIGSAGDDTAESLAVNATGTVYVAGVCSYRAITFGSVATPAGGSSYAARLTDAGPSSTFAWALRGGGSGYDGARAVAVTPAGRVYVGGSYTYTGTFGNLTLPDPGTYQLNTGYLAYAQDTPLATLPAAAELALTLFPNPTAGTATVSYFLSAASAVQAEVYDVLGRSAVHLAAGKRQTAGPHTLAVPMLKPGLYTVRLTHEGGTAYRKLVVQ